jgi:two-component system sensor kinase FixL
MAINLTDPIPVGKRLLVLAACLAAMAGLIYCERFLGTGAALGGFFFLPLLVAAAYVPRWLSFVLAVALAVSRERLGPFEWGNEGFARLALTTVAFAGGALFAGELVRNRRITLALLSKTKQEERIRADAEQEARALVEGSPAAVLTVDSEGKVAMANEAARRLLGFTQGSPEGDAVEKYIPLLAKLQKSNQAVRMLRTPLEANGRRHNGDAFCSQIWVSSYASGSGRRLAAIVLDVTEQLRDREESGLRQLMSSSKIIASAVSHEMRNLAGAAGVLHHNLHDLPGLATHPDFQALGKVIDSVSKLSSADLEEHDDDLMEGVDVAELLGELRLVIAPTFQEAGVDLEWEISDSLPHVQAHHSGLLQVFINLAQNSCRALTGRQEGKLCITAYPLSELVVIRFADNGPGVPATEKLFQPFHSGASSTGLGLFISRAVIRTFGGELHHTQRPGECRFVVELPAVSAQETANG